MNDEQFSNMSAEHLDFQIKLAASKLSDLQAARQRRFFADLARAIKDVKATTTSEAGEGG